MIRNINLIIGRYSMEKRTFFSVLAVITLVLFASASSLPLFAEQSAQTQTVFKSPEEAENTRKKELEGFEYFKYKWGSYPKHDPNTNLKSI